MKHSPGPLAGLVTVGALSAFAAFAVACGGAKATSARSPAETATAPTAPSPQAPGTSTSPTASSVAISDEIRTRCGISDQDAYFPFDSAHLTSKDRTPLDLVARCFTSGPLQGRSVKLVGRADPRGESDYNLTLGQSRADAVGQYLDTRGMTRAKTQSTSRGAMDAKGTSEATWQQDRRVDVLLGD